MVMHAFYIFKNCYFCTWVLNNKNYNVKINIIIVTILIGFCKLINTTSAYVVSVLQMHDIPNLCVIVPIVCNNFY